jgi:hypothetical protein
MFHEAGYRFIAAMLVDVVVGFWAATVNAPPEVTGGIASGLGAVCGMMAFSHTIASRFYRKRMTGQA